MIYPSKKINAYSNIFVLSVKSYSFKCPSQVSWETRAQVACNSTLKYFCLYNSVIGEYVEGCNGPDWDRKGSKRIYAGDFSRGNCIKQRFQPFIFWTNGSVSDCIYAKSICGEEGQVLYKENSPKDDRACRCDYENNYAFIKTPRNSCFCIPTEEDCSCYIKSCPIQYTLSADYRCNKYDSKERTKCIDITKNNKTLDKKPEVCKDGDHLCSSKTTSKLTRSFTAPAIICICIILIIGGLFVAILPCEKLPPLNRYCHKSQTDYSELKVGKIPLDEKVPQTSTFDDGKLIVGEIQLDEKVHQLSTFDALTKDEVRFLRLIHLLFRVACPVVRMTFNHEIHPNQLRKTLHRNKALLAKLYRRTGNIINDFQWNLLFKEFTVKSEDFDIRLMIYLLHTLANIKVCDSYPLPTDTSTSAMLSRIKYIRNETTQNLNGKLTEDQFNQYWDDIGQVRSYIIQQCVVEFMFAQNIRFNFGIFDFKMSGIHFSSKNKLLSKCL
ncbi:unnamed protein product [Mytilus coruscus]|uniref:DZIP3-like HEPN domain-containing protein n=1 Tax=Mytilus coruscus TaxID=42192 RepID=A0A6J8EAR4_MYTCO|nr:unnamed protein product [Mytilus coruscus]